MLNVQRREVKEWKKKEENNQKLKMNNAQGL